MIVNEFCIMHHGGGWYSVKTQNADGGPSYSIKFHGIKKAYGFCEQVALISGARVDGVLSYTIYHADAAKTLKCYVETNIDNYLEYIDILRRVPYVINVRPSWDKTAVFFTTVNGMIPQSVFNKTGVIPQ